MSKKRRVSATGGAIVASAATAVAAAMICAPILRIASLWPPHFGSRLDVIASAPASWGARWESLSQSADFIQRDSLASLSTVVGDLLMAALAISALSLTMHAVSRILTSWRGLAIRCALGATLRDLLALVGRDFLRLALAGWLIGVLIGGAALGALHHAWPARLEHSLGIIPIIAAAAGGLLGIMLLLQTIALLMLASLQRGVVRTIANLQGDHVTASGGMMLLQSSLAVIQLAALLIVTYGAVLFLRSSALSGGGIQAGSSAGRGIATLSWAPDATVAERAAGYQFLLARLPADVQITSPDATLALGPRLMALSICLRCHVGMTGRLINADQVRIIAASALPGAGRLFRAGDTLGARRVAVLNPAANYSIFPGANPVHLGVQLGTVVADNHLVIGIAHPEIPRGLGNLGDEPPLIIVPLLQNPPTLADIIAPDSVWGRIRALLVAPADGSRIVPQLGPIQPLCARLTHFGAPLKWFSGLCLGLAGMASGVAAYSLAAVMHQIVKIRERDIAIRVALGAAPHDIEKWVTRRSLSITATGVCVGLSFARWLAMLLHDKPEQSDVNDLSLLGLMVLVFGALGILASWLPAKRAARVHPRAVWSDPSA
ncbi:MAG TPA: FtsX-like permease family protein [Gemmatimonadales bacterium]